LAVFGLVDSLAIYLPFFGAGVLLSQMKWIAKTSTLRFSMLAAGLIFLFIAVYPESRRSVMAVGNVQVFGQDVTRIVDVLLAIATVPFVSINVRNRETKLGFHAGNLSFPLYLVHWVALGPYIALYGGLPFRARLPYFVGYLVVCLIASLIIYVLIDRPIDGWRRKKLGQSRSSSMPPAVAHG
jgi:peptidoglycan/LPS O-acetylase OafA/YrhL